MHYLLKGKIKGDLFVKSYTSDGDIDDKINKDLEKFKGRVKVINMSFANASDKFHYQRALIMFEVL